MVKKGELFNAYSSYFSILENVGQYPQGDANRLILLSFLEQMKADGFYNTLSAEDRKVIDKIIDCIRKKLCILPYTSTCMKKKVDKVYIGEYEDCIFYNKTVPQYEDMNANWQIQTVYCAKNAQNYNNGRKVTVWQNTNALFKGPQTKTEITMDTSSCPYNAPNWVEQSRSCEQVSGANTGYVLVLYRDTNTNSSTYGQTKTEKILDTTTCPLPNTDPTWVEISRACKTVSYEHSSDPSALHTYGVAAVTYRDVNPLSPTPEAEREYTTDENDPNCPAENVGYLTYNNGQLTKTVSANSDAYSITLPLLYYVNDVLQNPWNGNVTPTLLPGGMDITTHDGDCTITISAPKNTTGINRTLVGKLGADYFDGEVVFTLNQSADAVFKWSDNSLAKNDTAVAAGVTKNYTVVSTAGGEFKSYSVSSATSGISASISNNTVTVTVAQNPNTSARTLVLKLKQQGSNNEITLTVQQEAAAQPQPVAVFTVSPASLSFIGSGETKTLTVNSKVDNVTRDYSITNNFSNATVTKNGSTVTVTANSTSTALSGSILLTQTGTGNTITVPVTQAASAYVFTWGDDTNEPKVLTADPDGDEAQYVVKSYKDGNIYYTWDVEGEIPTWVHTNKVVPASGDPSINFTIDRNNGYRQRPGDGTQTITLRQKEGNVVKNTLAFQVSQAGSTAESFDLNIQAGPNTVQFPTMTVTTFISGETQAFFADGFEGYESGIVRMPVDGEIEFSVTVQEMGGGPTYSANTRYAWDSSKHNVIIEVV